MDIHTLDLNFQGLAQTIASYLVIGPKGPVLVETGPATTLATLRARLSDYGYELGDIRHVLVTHIHLDHSGAAGWLAREGAHIYVHHVGAAHIIDPSRLLFSASRIYGGAMEKLWGETVPAPAEQVTAVYDGDIIAAAGLEFVALDTPGHAWHHHCYRLGDVAFTGDAAGIRINAKPFVDLPAPPPEFKLEIWQQTIDRLLAEQLSAIYPTHFGRVDNVNEQLKRLRALMTQAAEFIRVRMQASAPHARLVEEYIAWRHADAVAEGLTEAEIQQYDLANPPFMSVDGILRYWQKKLKP
jgi:glyoxylase-like metal-dependent hydrolase (beta-lactamase superfamily II)